MTKIIQHVLDVLSETLKTVSAPFADKRGAVSPWVMFVIFEAESAPAGHGTVSSRSGPKAEAERQVALGSHPCLLQPL